MISFLDRLRRAGSRRAPRPPHEGLFYCDGTGADSPECLEPRFLDAMQYGCAACVPEDWKPFDVWLASAVSAPASNADRETDVTAIARAPHLFASTRFRCRHGLKVVVRCPACQKTIDLRNYARPVATVGSVHAGKSVLHAALAYELSRKDGDGLFARTGLACRPSGSAHRRYEIDVVNRLIERGELPRKTWLDEYHKAVYQIDDLRARGWASRSVLLTDVAGEVYDDDVTPAITALRTILLWAREMVLVVDPGNNGTPGGIGGRQLPEPLDVADRVVEHVLLPTGQIEPPHTGAVRRAVAGAARALQDSHWPDAPIIDAAACVLRALSLAGFSLDEGARARVLSALEGGDIDGPSIPTNSGVVNWLIRYLEAHSDFDLVDGKLPYSVAVAVTKSESIEDELGAEWREPIQAGPHALAADWARELNRVSDWSKDRLARIGAVESELVATLESRFSKVGCFFVSGLGRATDFDVRPDDTQGRARVRYDQPTPGEPRGSSGKWWVTFRTVSAGEDGSPRPAPVGVLHPLLWLLCQNHSRTRK